VKALTLIFVILIALIQYPLWLGKGSWLRVWDLNRQIADQQEKNNGLKARNETLDAEVLDLKSGRAAIEERARSELGMVKQDEVFYQVLENAVIKNTEPENTVRENKVLENTAATNTPTISETPASQITKTPLKPIK
jgi:cell division protein FtsB